MRCSAKLIRAFTPVFAGYTARCSADPGPFQTPSLERSRLKAGTRVERCETNVRITTLNCGDLDKERTAMLIEMAGTSPGHDN
jgi:hypothetical protein